MRGALWTAQTGVQEVAFAGNMSQLMRSTYKYSNHEYPTRDTSIKFNNDSNHTHASIIRPTRELFSRESPPSVVNRIIECLWWKRNPSPFARGGSDCLIPVGRGSARRRSDELQQYAEQQKLSTEDPLPARRCPRVDAGDRADWPPLSIQLLTVVNPRWAVFLAPHR